MSSSFLLYVIVVGLACLQPIISERDDARDDDVRVLTYQVATLPVGDKRGRSPVVSLGQPRDVGKPVVKVHELLNDDMQANRHRSGSFPRSSGLHTSETGHRSGRHNSRHSKRHPCTRRNTQETLQLMFENAEVNSHETKHRLKQIEENLIGSDAAAILCRIRHRKLTKAENATQGEKLYGYIRDGQTDAVVLLARHGCSVEDVSYNETILADMQQFISTHKCWEDTPHKLHEETKQGSLDGTRGGHKKNKKMARTHHMIHQCKILKRFQKCKQDVSAAAAAAAAAAASTTTTKRPHRIGKIPPASLRYSISDKEYDEFIFY